MIVYMDLKIVCLTIDEVARAGAEKDVVTFGRRRELAGRELERV